MGAAEKIFMDCIICTTHMSLFRSRMGWLQRDSISLVPLLNSMCCGNILLLEHFGVVSLPVETLTQYCSNLKRFYSLLGQEWEKSFDVGYSVVGEVVRTSPSPLSSLTGLIHSLACLYLSFLSKGPWE